MFAEYKEVFMKEENQRCPSCGKLIDKEKYISVDSVNYCDTKCFEEFFVTIREDECVPFLK